MSVFISISKSLPFPRQATLFVCVPSIQSVSESYAAEDVHGFTAGIGVHDRTAYTVGIPIERQWRGNLPAHDILLAEPVYSRLIQPCAQVEHAGGCVVGEGLLMKSDSAKT